MVSLSPVKQTHKPKIETEADQIHQELKELNPDALIPIGLENAVVGIGYHNGSHAPVGIYDINKCLQILMMDDPDNFEDALENFVHNTFSAAMGPNSPIYMQTPENLL